ncbi:hypothetical protein ABZ491_16700 [Micromonospora rifamycinica]|uniref:hypothetical protein n=1 Tax=Micromonospora rifamycinica TaxID=291594 RepID=UPI0033D9E68F
MINTGKWSCGIRTARRRLPGNPLQEVSMPALHTPGNAVDDISEEGVFSYSDHRQLADTISAARFASTATPATLLALTPARQGSEAALLTEQACVFDHCGVLLFPDTLEAGLRHLDRMGLAPLPATPSVVVRHRLVTRYLLDPAGCDITITRLRLALPDGRRHAAVEAFLFPRDRAGYHRQIEANEVAYGFERHTAFVVRRPDTALLARLVTAWRTDAGLLWEGGGYNPHEGGPEGSTVLYFVRDQPQQTRRRRFELHCAGDFRAFLDGLARNTDAVDRAYRRWQTEGPADAD